MYFVESTFCLNTVQFRFINQGMQLFETLLFHHSYDHLDFGRHFYKELHPVPPHCWHKVTEVS